MYFKDWDLYRKALSLAHTLERKFQIMDEMKGFWRAHVDYIDSNMDAGAVISCMHQLTLLVIHNMGKYYPSGMISMVLVQSLKHCVRFPANVLVLVLVLSEECCQSVQ